MSLAAADSVCCVNPFQMVSRFDSQSLCTRMTGTGVRDHHMLRNNVTPPNGLNASLARHRFNNSYTTFRSIT